MKPKAVIFSSYNILAINLAKALVEKNCEVLIAAPDSREWGKTDFEIVSFNSLSENADYIFIIDGFPKYFSLENLNKAFEFIKKTTAKSAIIFPFTRSFLKREVSELLGEQFVESQDFESAVIYVGQVYGPGLDLKEPKSWFEESLIKASLNKPIDLPSHEFNIFPIFVADAVNALVRKMFSYGFEKKEMVLAERSTPLGFIKDLRKMNPGLKVQKSEAVNVPFPVPVSNFIEIRNKDEEALEKTIDWIRQNTDSEITIPKLTFEIPKTVRKKIKPKKFKINRKLILSICIFLFWFLAFPFFNIAISATAFKIVYESVTKAKFQKAETFLKIGTGTSLIAKKELSFLIKIPLLGRVFDFPFKGASLLADFSKVGEESLEIARVSQDLFKKILGDSNYDLSQISQDLAVALDGVYKKSSFLESEVKNISSLEKIFVKELSNFSNLRKNLLAAKSLTERLPVLLGNEKRVSYLVVFQNNMELRPTGGFIGSFGLISFEKGRLIDISVYDVYSADGQLKGHVEPPLPIKNYLGEANWFLRDSNWDPDFPASATQMEWFLEKEIEKEVEGVIGIDLEVVKSLLSLTGPIKLADFNETLDSNNLYEKLQNEVESDFFPGSRKKANILTALTKELISSLQTLASSKIPQIGKLFALNLDQKHVQIFLHDRQSQKTIASLGWGGTIEAGSCDINCESIWFGVNEANLGVNKVNYFVARSTSVKLVVDEKKVKTRLEINLKNTSPAISSLGGNYKAYIRLLSSVKSSFDNVEVVSSGKSEFVRPEIVDISARREAGVLVNISPNESKKIVFSWEFETNLVFQSPGEILVKVRKQPGLLKDPLFISMRAPVALTSGTPQSYNTTLEKDLDLKFNW